MSFCCFSYSQLFAALYFHISYLLNRIAAEDLPVFALQDDRVVEVVGDPSGVHKAVELIASHLRKFLVDRSIIPLFEMHVSVLF